MKAVLKQAWILRWQDDIDGARALHTALSEKVRDTLEQSELDLLHASFLRRQLRNAEAKECIEKVRQRLRNSGQTDSFQLIMQTAICMDVDSNFADSHFLYLQALNVASDDVERFMAKLNLIIARFNLGLDIDHLFDELAEDTGPKHPLRNLLDKALVLQTEKRFLSGEFNRIIDSPVNGAAQSLYQRAWFEALPWIGIEKHRKQFADRILIDANFFGGKYGLETLQMDPRWQSAKESTIQFLVDRIYLWTWKWLEEPSAIQSQMLSKELANFPFFEAAHRMTFFDVYMLRSAGRWLSIYCDKFDSQFRQWLSKYDDLKLPPSSFFEIDAQACDCVKQGDSIGLKRLSANHPHLETYFSLVDRILSDYPRRTEQNTDGLSVNIAASTLKTREATIVWQPACQLLSHLQVRKVLSFSEALFLAFGISQYDEDVHRVKLRNLIQRLKPHLPSLVQIYTKDQKIYLEDPAGQIHVLQGSTRHLLFPQFEISSTNSPKRQVARHRLRRDHSGLKALADILAEKSSCSADEIQSRLGLSRATTQRLIKSWLSSNLLVRVGRGSKTRYSYNSTTSPNFNNAANDAL